MIFFFVLSFKFIANFHRNDATTFDILNSFKNDPYENLSHNTTPPTVEYMISEGYSLMFNYMGRERGWWGGLNILNIK